MKKFISTLALSVAFFAQGYADTQVAPAGTSAGIPALSDKKVNIEFTAPDDTPWKLGDDNSDQSMRLRRFVVGNETPDLWTELFSVHEYYGVTGNLKDFYNNFIKSLKQEQPKSDIQSKIITEDKDAILFEWWITSGLTARHEWVKVMTDGKNVVLLRFSTRKMADVESERSKWVKALESAKISTATQN